MSFYLCIQETFTMSTLSSSIAIKIWLTHVLSISSPTTPTVQSYVMSCVDGRWKCVGYITAKEQRKRWKMKRKCRDSSSSSPSSHMQNYNILPQHHHQLTCSNGNNKCNNSNECQLELSRVKLMLSWTWGRLRVLLVEEQYSGIFVVCIFCDEMEITVKETNVEVCFNRM